MLINRVAYDRFEVALPSAGPGADPLGDARIAGEVAGWLWQFGPTPLIAIVEHDGMPPTWLSTRLTISVPWNGRAAAAILLERREDLEWFLVAGAPHTRTRFLWPRVSAAKTFEGLCAGRDAWEATVDAHAYVGGPDVIEVLQLQPSAL